MLENNNSTIKIYTREEENGNKVFGKYIQCL